jgi:hypothetical protein
VEEFGIEMPDKLQHLTKPERVFQLTNPRPIETSTTFPDSLINSENNFATFLDRDEQKAMVLKNYKNINRDLTKAYLRQTEMKSMFKAKGAALPEQQIKIKKEDDETFDRVSSLFDKMMKRSKYGMPNK